MPDDYHPWGFSFGLMAWWTTQQVFGGRGSSTMLGDADLVVASGSIGGFCICSESCCVLGCDAASDGGDLVPRLQVLKPLVRTGLAIS